MQRKSTPTFYEKTLNEFFQFCRKHPFLVTAIIILFVVILPTLAATTSAKPKTENNQRSKEGKNAKNTDLIQPSTNIAVCPNNPYGFFSPISLANQMALKPIQSDNMTSDRIMNIFRSSKRYRTKNNSTPKNASAAEQVIAKSIVALCENYPAVNRYITRVLNSGVKLYIVSQDYFNNISFGGMRGMYKGDTHALYFSESLLQEPHDISTNIAHEFWHAYQRVINNLLPKSIDGDVSNKASPYSSREEFEAFKKAYEKDSKRIERFSELLRDEKAGVLKITESAMKIFTRMKKTLSNNKLHTYHVTLEKNEYEMRFGFPKAGQRISRNNDYQETLLRVVDQGDKYRLSIQVDNPFWSLIENFKHLVKYVKTSYPHNTPETQNVFLIEMDAYINQEYHDTAIRKVFFKDLAAYHKTREEKAFPLVNTVRFNAKV